MRQLLFLLFLLLPLNAFAQDEAAAPSDPIPVDQQVEDDEIRDRIASLLEKAGVARGADIQVADGVVTIRGQARTIDSQEQAASLARRVEGVIVVNNELEVVGGVDLDQSVDKVSRSLFSLWNDFMSRLPFVAAGLVVLLFTWLTSKIVQAALHRTLDGRKKIRGSFKDLMKQLVAIGIWVIGLMIAAVVAFEDFTPAKVLTVLGLSSVAVGFAFKDIFENFFAGILILWRYPFDKGDVITVTDLTGRVEDITVRNTMLRRMDGRLLVLPNSLLFKNPVDVVTSRSTRRQTVICGVAYDEDVDEAREVIRKAVEACKSVSGAGDVQIFAQEFADSSINFEVTWWTGSTPLDERQSRDEIVAAVKRALDDAGIEIPFPYRTLTFKGDVPVSTSGQDAE